MKICSIGKAKVQPRIPLLRARDIGLEMAKMDMQLDEAVQLLDIATYFDMKKEKTPTDLAGIDYYYLGFGLVGGYFKSRIVKLFQHYLGVNEVLRASEGDKCNLSHIFSLFRIYFSIFLNLGRSLSI